MSPTREHKTNKWVRIKINCLADPLEPHLTTVKRQKLSWFGHVTRHDSLSKTSLQDTLEVGRRRGGQRKCLKDNVKELTSLTMLELLTMASCRKDWKRISAESSLTSPGDPNRLRNLSELKEQRLSLSALERISR